MYERIKRIITLAILLIFFSTYGQTQNLILTGEQNGKWCDNLKKLTLEQQLFTIKERILADTNVFVRQSYPDRIMVADSLGDRVYGEGKPTLIVGGYVMFMDNKTKSNRIVSLTMLLTPTYIGSVIILSPNDSAAAALYGSAGQFGIIVMTVAKKKYVKLFRRLELNANYCQNDGIQQSSLALVGRTE